ncbi:MAG: hypothetical protein CEE40_00580 [Chloroflexi bacterium B3_Chlor]|nr:MAG: hypothetical protein CEE40_00580 [Chloroflexi bacterium B3_Chlor]
MRKNLFMTGVLLLLLALAMVLGGCERAKPAPSPTAEISPEGPGGTVTVAAEETPATSPEVSASVTPPPSADETPSPPPSQPPAPPPAEGVEHVVAWGETISLIASRYGVTAEDIVAANNLANPNLIRAGDVLIIPGVSAPSPQPGVHIVRRGENLRSIANMYGITVDALARANGIANPNYIWVGQSLTIPGGSATQAGGQTYVVQRGDTLSSIAVGFGTTAWAIAYANNLPNVNFIYVGQTLRIP